MKRIIFQLLIFVLLAAAAVCSADIEEDTRLIGELFAEAFRYPYEGDWEMWNEFDGSPRFQESWTYDSGLVLALYNIFGDQTENSFTSALNGTDFYGIPNEWLAKDYASAETAIALQQVSITTSSKSGSSYKIHARLLLGDPKNGKIVSESQTPDVPLTAAEKEAFNLSSVVSCTEFLAEYADKTANPNGYSGRYDEAMALYNAEKYYSARQAFIESQYGDWEAMAEKCIRQRPSTGELWHDPSVWVRDMYLTFRIDQPADTSIFLRLYKDGKPVSYVFVAGPGETTVELPGNGYYTIKDGIGRTWYGTKEAFGPDGSYETMTFDEAGTEKVYLQSYYQYTISINVEGTGTGIGSKDENWDNFAED